MPPTKLSEKKDDGALDVPRIIWHLKVLFLVFSKGDVRYGIKLDIQVSQIENSGRI
jgi:hypothetical protein